MTTQPAHLVDQESNRIAVLHVEPAGELFRGTICLADTPPGIKRLFEEFEENVEGQMFPLADEVEERAALLGGQLDAFYRQILGIDRL